MARGLLVFLTRGPVISQNGGAQSLIETRAAESSRKADYSITIKYIYKPEGNI